MDHKNGFEHFFDIFAKKIVILIRDGFARHNIIRTNWYSAGPSIQPPTPDLPEAEAAIALHPAPAAVPFRNAETAPLSAGSALHRCLLQSAGHSPFGLHPKGGHKLR